MHRYSWKCWCSTCCGKRRIGLIAVLTVLTGVIIGITTSGWNYYGGWK